MADSHSSSPRLAPAHKSLGRFWIGLAILSAIGLMGLSAWRQGWFTPTEHLFLVLDTGTQGVQTGTLVKLKGFKIGEVDHVTLTPELNVNVRMRVTRDKLALLNADSEVKLSRDTPIGAKYIEFLPGAKPKGSLKADATVPLHTGGDVEDLMLVVKGGIEKLNAALGKIEPILDDVKKLTGEAANMRETTRVSVSAMLANLQALSGQLRQIGQTAQGMAGSVEADRVIIMTQIKDIVKTLDATVTKDVPQMTNKVNQALDDVKKLTAGAATDIPPALRSVRVVTQDVAEITDGAKNAWPISSLIKEEAPSKPLPLDAFEAKK